LAQKGDYQLTAVLDTVAQCGQEPRDSVWLLLVRTLGFAGMLTEGNEQCEKQLRQIKGRLAGYWFDKLGWDDRPADGLNAKLLRHTMLSLKISSEEADILARASKRFQSAKSVQQLPAEQRAMIAAAEVRFGSPASIKKLTREYESTQNPEVQHAITAALCSTKDPKTARELIAWGLSKNGKVKDQDTPRWFAYLMRNRHTRREAWRWLVRDWDGIFAAYSKSIDHFLLYASSPLSTPAQQQSFVEFFQPKRNIVILQRAIKIASAAIDARVKWRQREEPKLKRYLTANT
jgi:aminopeptidase N